MNKACSQPEPEQRTVLHIIDVVGPGGAQQVVLDLVRGLDRSSWRPIVAVPNAGWLTQELSAYGVEWVLTPMTGGAYDVRYLSALRRTMRQKGVDLIHAHLLGPAVYAGLARLGTSVPLVVTFHGQTDVDLNERFRRLKMAIVNASALSIVFVSDALRTHFVDRFAASASKTCVIHNGVDFTASATNSQCTQDGVGVASGARLIGAIGHVRPPKNYAFLMRVAAAMRERANAYKFIIAGAVDDQEYYEELLELRHALELDDIVQFVGFRRDLANLLQTLDAYFLSSSSEGLSLSTIHAMAGGVPVVATRCGGPEEIISDGVTGLLVEVNDVRAAAEALERVIIDRDYCADMTQAARDAVTARFTLAKTIERYDALYHSALRPA